MASIFTGFNGELANDVELNVFSDARQYIKDHYSNPKPVSFGIGFSGVSRGSNLTKTIREIKQHFSNPNITLYFGDETQKSVSIEEFPNLNSTYQKYVKATEKYADTIIFGCDKEIAMLSDLQGYDEEIIFLQKLKTKIDKHLSKDPAFIATKIATRQYTKLANQIDDEFNSTQYDSPHKPHENCNMNNIAEDLLDWKSFI